MQHRAFVCGTVLMALAAGGAWVTAAEDSKAAEVLAAAREALGGTSPKPLKTFTVEASLQRNVGNVQLTSDVEILVDLPDRYLRSDAPSGPMNAGFTLGFNGDKPIQRSTAPSAGGGLVIRMGGPGIPSAPPGGKLSPEDQQRADEALVRMARADLSRLMLGWFANSHPTLQVEYTYAGEAESPDGKAHAIEVKGADGFAARLFIDQQTHLPLMVTYRAPQPRIVTVGGPRRSPSSGSAHGREGAEGDRPSREDAEKRLRELQRQPPEMVDYTLYFDDWREVDGVKFPHVVRRAIAGGATDEEWTITSVRINPKIDPKRFEG